MERFKLLSDADIFRIDQASRSLLSDIGVRMADERAQSYYDKAGARVDPKTNIIRVPDHVITETLEKCASSVRLYDRRGAKPMIIGGDDVYFGTVGIATNVLDFHTDQYRAVLSQDLIDIIELSDVLDPPDYILVPATPTDVPSETVDLWETKLLLEHTSKHFIAEAQNAQNCRKTIEMCAEVAGGLDKFQERPFMTMLVTLTSPLHGRQDVADLIIESALAKTPLFIESGPMSGGTGPATLAGNLVCANAEILHAIVLAKAVNPEVPVVYASWARLLDMKAATCSHGGPEFAMLRVGTTQLAKHYGLPSGGGAILADTKGVDVQLGMEKMGTGLLPALAYTNMCTGMGLFADENAINLDTLVLDWEVTAWIKRVLRGIEVNERTCDLEVFREVGYGGDFVRTDHTFENFKKETFLPRIMDRGYLALDKDPLAHSMRKRIKEIYPKLMKGYKKPADIDETTSKKLDAIIAR
jgi:trimethylamine--corrinoid protein Co-methyltransferase